MKNIHTLVATLLCLFVFEFSIVSSNQICDAFDQGACPSDTCCKQSICDDEGGTYKCCTDAGIGCSNCPTCGKLIDIYIIKRTFDLVKKVFMAFGELVNIIYDY